MRELISRFFFFKKIAKSSPIDKYRVDARFEDEAIQKRSSTNGFFEKWSHAWTTLERIDGQNG